MANGQKQDGSIVTAEIQDGAVTTPKIADQAVTTGKIADGAVTYAKMQDVSATDRLLGRVSSGSGVVEEIVLDTDGTLAADSDDRVSTQKAVKAYVDAAVGGGGQPRIIPVTEYYQTWTASTAGANLGHQSHGIPVDGGTYKIKGCFRVGAQTNNPTQVELRSPTLQALIAIDVVAKTQRTLIAANTNISTWNKGSSVAGGDIFTFESSNITLNDNEFIKSDGNAPPFQGKCNGTSATASCSGTAIYLEKQ